MAVLVIGVFAVLFAKERLYADAGYFLVRIIDEQGFHVINHRWVMPLIQWLPVLGVKFGLGLPAVIVLYSLGNVVLAAFLFLFTLLVLRDRVHALLILGTQFIGLSHAVFCPVFELYYGAMLLLTIRAVLHTDQLKPSTRSAIALVLFVLVATCHFLGLLVLLLMLMWERIWKERRLFLLFTGALVLVMAHRFLAISTYESDALDMVRLRFGVAGIQWMFAPSRLVGHAVQAAWHYPEVILISLTTVVHAVRRKAWRPLCLFLTGHLTIYALISLYFPDGTHSRYREMLDYTHTVWTLVGAAWSIEHIGWQRLFSSAFLVLLFLRTAWTIHIGGTFTARMHWIEERIGLAHAQGARKAIDLAHRNFIPAGFHNAPLYDPSPCEYLLLAAMKGPSSSVVMISSPHHSPTSAELATLEQRLDREGVMLPKDDGPYFDMPEGPFTILSE